MGLLQRIAGARRRRRIEPSDRQRQKSPLCGEFSCRRDAPGWKQVIFVAPAGRGLSPGNAGGAGDAIGGTTTCKQPCGAEPATATHFQSHRRRASPIPNPHIPHCLLWPRGAQAWSLDRFNRRLSTLLCSCCPRQAPSSHFTTSNTTGLVLALALACLTRPPQNTTTSTHARLPNTCRPSVSVHPATTVQCCTRHELLLLLPANETGTLDRVALPAAPDLDSLHRLGILQRHQRPPPEPIKHTI